MWDKIIEIFTQTPLWELALIFFSRIIEVTMGTLRMILINKGYRKQGVILAFFEVTLWIFVASRVITGINEAPLKAIIYSLGFASGVYFGSKLETHLAFGKVLIQVITSMAMGPIVASFLREEGLGVTSIDAHGKDEDKVIIMTFTQRRGNSEIIEKIKAIDEHAVIVSNDISSLHGGYISSWRRFVK